MLEDEVKHHYRYDSCKNLQSFDHEGRPRNNDGLGTIVPISLILISVVATALNWKEVWPIVSIWWWVPFVAVSLAAVFLGYLRNSRIK